MHYFASMPYDAHRGVPNDNIWPKAMGEGNVGDINYWGILNTQRQPSHAPSGPSGYVGGEVFSANKLSVLAPYLIGIFSVVAVAGIVAKRKFT